MNLRAKVVYQLFSEKIQQVTGDKNIEILACKSGGPV